MPDSTSEQLKWIPFNQLKLHPHCRPHREDKLQELMNSMRVRGQLEPARGRPKDGLIEVYIGAGRYAGAQKLNWDALWVIVTDRSEEDVDLDMLHENLKREDLDPIAEAFEYQYNMKAHQWDQVVMAEKAGLTQAAISQALALLRLPPEAQDLIKRLILTKSHGVTIEKLDNPEIEMELAQGTVDKKLSVEDTQMAVEIYHEKGLEAMREFLIAGGKVHKGSKLNRARPGDGAVSFWPGLPEGVQASYQKGWVLLRWSPKRYTAPKTILEELLKSAPAILDLPKKEKRKIKT